MKLNMKSGFVSIVGRPNVGKSTLLNKIMNRKLAITSDKVGTTRNNIYGVYNDDDTQIVFIDTPGIARANNRLGTVLNKKAYEAMENDIVLFIVDIASGFGRGDEKILNKLKQEEKEVILVLNKVDRINKETPEFKKDLGFRVFRLDEGNYEDVKRSPKEFKQDQLDLFLNNIKADRNDLDLLFGCMLDWGVQLSLPMTQEVVDGKAIYTVNDGDLVACFAENVSEDVVKAMAEKMPLRVIFRDSCFAQDADKINIYETFKQKLDWSDQEVVKNIRVI